MMRGNSVDKGASAVTDLSAMADLSLVTVLSADDLSIVTDLSAVTGVSAKSKNEKRNARREFIPNLQFVSANSFSASRLAAQPSQSRADSASPAAEPSRLY